MADAVAKYSGTHTSSRVTLEVVAIPSLHNLVINGEVPDVYASVGARGLFERYTRVLETLKDGLQQLALLGVHIQRLEIVYAEEAVLKLPAVLVEEVPPLGDDTPWAIAIWVVEGIDVKPRLGDVASPRFAL